MILYYTLIRSNLKIMIQCECSNEFMECNDVKYRTRQIFSSFLNLELRAAQKSFFSFHISNETQRT